MKMTTTEKIVVPVEAWEDEYGNVIILGTHDPAEAVAAWNAYLVENAISPEDTDYLITAEIVEMDFSFNWVTVPFPEDEEAPLEFHKEDGVDRAPILIGELG